MNAKPVQYYGHVQNPVLKAGEKIFFSNKYEIYKKLPVTKL